VITGISVAALLVWAAVLVPHVRWENLLAAEVEAGGTPLFPYGAAGIVAALPAAGWFYLAIEGVPLAAEETRDPSRDLSRGMIAAMLSLVALSFLTLILAPGVAGPERLGTAANPLPLAIEAAVGRTWAYWAISAVGLLGLVASFLSIIFAYSRQIFALSRAGYLPRWLSRTNRHRSPHWALIVPAILGWSTIQGVDALNDSDTATGDLLLQMAVFAALISYVAMMLSHLVLRRRYPDLPRPFRTPGHPVLPSLALVLALAAMTSTLFYGDAPRFAVIGTACVLGIGVLYFLLWSRHRLVAAAPEEEFAVVRRAEAELGG
jgi:ethanolamine permease